MNIPTKHPADENGEVGFIDLVPLQNRIIKINKANGFYDILNRPNLATRCMLMVTEIAEIVEAERDGNPESTKIPGFSSIEEEVADLVIRALDFSYCEKLDLSNAIAAKLEFNAKRPYRHGKKY